MTPVQLSNNATTYSLAHNAFVVCSLKDGGVSIIIVDHTRPELDSKAASRIKLGLP